MANIIVKKSSLEDIMDGWDESCYAYIKPATYEDRKQFREASDVGPDELEEFQAQLVKSHFVSGYIMSFDPKAKDFQLVEMTEEDLSIGLINDRLAMDIMGFDLDPKEWADELEAAKQTSEEASTKTPSSTDSPKN
ncbi:MAG: hypothetical protein WA991_03945 [Ornithinimicrobium sp.]